MKINLVYYFPSSKPTFADPSGRAIEGVGLPPLACWDCGFESCQGYGCLSHFSVLLSGRGLCVGLITRPEESYRVWWVWVWSWTLDKEDTLAHWGCCATVQKKTNFSAPVPLHFILLRISAHIGVIFREFHIELFEFSTPQLAVNSCQND